MPDGRVVELATTYLEGYPNPALVLEGRAIGAFVDEDSADAMMDFLLAVAQLPPDNITYEP